jgi:phosphoglycerate dehydrogenase-like enzyme
MDVKDESKPCVAFCGNEAWQVRRVFALGRRERLEAEAEVFPELITLANFDRLAPSLQNVEALFSTWGISHELALRLRELPKLLAFFYAAGSVQHFARPLLEKNLVVVSAWAANAVPVAQFTLAQILLSLKGYFRNLRDTRKWENRSHLVRYFRNLRDSRRPEKQYRLVRSEVPGIFAETVALLGCGMVGRAVAQLIRPFGLKLIAYDPFLPDAEASALGIRKVTLQQAFAEAMVISNHLADVPPTRGLLDGALFASMRSGATFINTGRGATVVEAELAEVLRARPDLTALLDVTWPEPPPRGSPLYALDNAHLSSHIAGSLGNEVVRLADYCLEEFAAWKQGKPLQYQVSLKMLDTMA